MIIFKQYHFIKLLIIPSLLAFMLGVFSCSEKFGKDSPPNIVFIFADDLGYADISLHGSQDISTPHIDSLANEGIRCTSGYVTAPACTPSRASLLTGRYQQRFGYESNIDIFSGLPGKEITFGDVLQSTGYRTGLVGKWHVGLGPGVEYDDGTKAMPTRDQHPLERGFHEYYGALGNTYFMDTEGKGGIEVMRGKERILEKEYLTDAHGREAVEFIDRNKDKPFFLFLSFNAVHIPLEAPQKYLDRFNHIDDIHRKTYAAMVSAMDDAIGRVLNKLREEQLIQNTLVIFLNDHGGSFKSRVPKGGMSFKGKVTPQSVPSVWKKIRDNSPFRGGKGSIEEGGIRVPFIMSWPGKLPAGKVYDQPVTSMDILPTIAAVGGAKLKENTIIDGVDLIPYLQGKKKDSPHPFLFWRWGIMNDYSTIPHMAVRMGQWKLKTRNKPWNGNPILNSEPKKLSGDLVQLFNVVKDPEELNNLANEFPELVIEMQRKLKNWNDEVSNEARISQLAPLPKSPPFYEALPKEFDYDQAISIAQKIGESGIPESILPRYLNIFMSQRKLSLTQEGKYIKNNFKLPEQINFK